MRASFHGIRCGGLLFALFVACGGPESSNEDGDGEQGGSSTETGGSGGSQGGSSTGGSATGGANAGTGTGGSGANAGSGTGGSGTGGSGTGGSGTGGSGTGGSGGDGGKAGTVTFPYCKQACSTPSDCAITNAPANDADNYACENGACVYTGCKSDAECSAQMAGYVCRSYPSSPYAGCTEGCSVPADCSLGVSAYDADNYTCDSGGCIYRGCNTDAECNESYPGRVCRRDSTGYGSCWEPCSTAADCVLTGAAFDEDNFTCSGGLCTYIGCHNDAECDATVYVCR